VFVVAYQNILKLSYIDKFLSEIQLRFRDKYKQEIQAGEFGKDFNDFRSDFDKILKMCETEARNALESEKKPRSYQESEKASKTVQSMIETKKGGILSSFIPASVLSTTAPVIDTSNQNNTKTQPLPPSSPESINDSPDSKMKKLINSGGGRQMKKFEPKKKTPTSPQQDKKGKKGTVWENGETGPLDYSNEKNGHEINNQVEQNDLEKYASKNDVGKGKDLRAIEVVDSPIIDDFEEDEEDYKQVKKKVESNKKQQTGGLFSSLKSLVGSKTLTKENIEPVMDKLQEHLIAKNVASEIAQKVCSNVAQNLEGNKAFFFYILLKSIFYLHSKIHIDESKPKSFHFHLNFKYLHHVN